VCSATRVANIFTQNGVLGVTSIDDELFVLLEQVVYQLAVYSINDYQLLRHLNVPGFQPHAFNDMTSCVRYRCLYMSDGSNSCIHRYDLASSDDLASSATSKWRVFGLPYGLSVTPSCNLLVTCHVPNKLVELSADSGQCVREIALQFRIVYPCHSVLLTTGQFVLCHGILTGSLHGVCVVGNYGKLTLYYGGQHGSHVGQLNYPCHLAVDEYSQFIFVADQYNDRLVMLSPTLEFVRYFSEGLSRPCRLHLHQATRRLFVGHLGGCVTVISL